MDFEELLHRYRESVNKPVSVQQVESTPTPPLPVVDKKVSTIRLMEALHKKFKPEEQNSNDDDDNNNINNLIKSMGFSVETNPIMDEINAIGKPPQPSVNISEPIFPTEPIQQIDYESREHQHECVPSQETLKEIRDKIREEESRRYMSRAEIDRKVNECTRMCEETKSFLESIQKQVFRIDLHFRFLRQIMAVDDSEIEEYIRDFEAHTDVVHEDDPHTDVHEDAPHTDAVHEDDPHTDAHEDAPHTDAHEDAPHTDVVHEDTQNNDAEVEKRKKVMTNIFFAPLRQAQKPATRRPLYI